MICSNPEYAIGIIADFGIIRPLLLVLANGERLEDAMPQGDKSSYTDKQKRQAEHIEKGYEKRGTPKKEAEGRAWATVNKDSGGGKKSGSGRGKHVEHKASERGERAHKKGSSEARTAAARKGWDTRRRNGNA
jgi:hypothetical protein